MPTKNKELRRLQNKRYRDAHPDTKNIRKRNETPEMKKRWNLKTRYGLTPEEAAGMLAGQGGLCAICGTVPKKPRIDHDHVTGQVRAILCHRCNLMIAGMDDPIFLQKALAYLEKHRDDAR